MISRFLPTRSRVLRALVKCGLFMLVVLVVLYPDPRLLARDVGHLRMTATLPDTPSALRASVVRDFDAFCVKQGTDQQDPGSLLQAVQAFVYRTIPYAWDWEVWGGADYLPTVEEVLEKGREDCDGRAVVAAAILRAKGIPAELVADLRHMWVRTPFGETMNPLGPPVFRRDDGRLRIDWASLLDPGPPAFGIAVFPFRREAIILLAAWVLLLPRHVGVVRASAMLLLLTSGLVLVRMGGADPVAPSYFLILLGIVQFGLALALAAARKRTAKYRPVGLE